MPDAPRKNPPPDQAERERALDAARSILVRAPAGSGKTDLLTRRFLRLLGEVDDPGQIVAITFTKAAAAEMRHRILSELENAAQAADELRDGKGTGFTGCGKALPEGQNAKGHDFTGCEKTLPEGQNAKGHDFTGCEKTPFARSFVTGHDFSRAESAAKNGGALAPENSARQTDDGFSMRALAQRALARSQALGWNLLDLPAQLRISTIDSFCRDLALQQPLLSGLGGGLEIGEQPAELYRRAARRALQQLDNGDPALREAIASLLLWRDNSWQDLENQLVAMLAKRDQWMHGFVLDRDPDWDALREKLERPFAREVRDRLAALDGLFAQAPGALEETLALARFACEQSGGRLHRELAEMAEFPSAPFPTTEAAEEARQAYVNLAGLLLTNDGGFRKRIDKNLGFPADRKAEKAHLLNLIASLAAVPGLESALAAIRDLPPARYGEEEWTIVRNCFTLLRHAAGELRVVFAEAAAADYIEVAQIAQNVLQGEDGQPSDAAIAVADGIHHLLVDEFQDTSRRQHRLLAHLIAAWPGPEGRTCFVVGDPMQSIYFFRDADAELFPRAEQLGLELPGEPPLRFDPVHLKSNFRTAPALVEDLNGAFAQIFAEDDGSGVTFAEALPARDGAGQAGPRLVGESAPRMRLHLEFVPAAARRGAGNYDAIAAEREAARQKQIEEIVALIRSHLPAIEQARAENEAHAESEREKKKYRVAVLGRARSALAPLALALRQAKIPFRAVELEELRQRPEIVDALALSRALLNPEDRVAWLGVLRAPWCGLSLADLHALAGDEDAELLARPIPDLLAERARLLSKDGQLAVERVRSALEFAERLRAAHPTAAPGTWLEQVWLRLGGVACVDAAARANLDLLWQSLDGLPQGEPDLLGSALDAALRDLKALPDPAADSDCGVQLMTVHAAKGLEFEVVIVPDLQAKTRGGELTMLSWLERGLPPQANRNGPNDADEITEFLIAPFQPKGTDRGAAKLWVDRVRREREKQETRRLLYVAATRAREELHLFARPEFKTSADGGPDLATPRDNLLATGWPAWEAEIRQRFETWSSGFATAGASTIESLAAAGEDNLRTIPSASRPAQLRRLPPEFQPATAGFPSAAFDEPLIGAGRLYERHEGGLLSRALGLAVHALFQELARLRETLDWEQAKAALAVSKPRLAAQIRAAGVAPAQADRLAAKASEIALEAAADPVGQWILSPRADAASELRWTGVVDGSLRTVQVDRLFRAGPAPRSAGQTIWWIVDYKTAHEDGLDPAAALPELRRIFAPQIEAYAKVLRNLHGANAPVRAGLYYPRMKQFDWWEL